MSQPRGEVAWSVALTSLQSLICIQEAPPWRWCERGCRKKRLPNSCCSRRGKPSSPSAVCLHGNCFSAAPVASILWTQIGLALILLSGVSYSEVVVELSWSLACFLSFFLSFNILWHVSKHVVKEKGLVLSGQFNNHFTSFGNTRHEWCSIWC